LKIRYCQFFYLAYNIKKKEKKEKGGRAIGKNRLYALCGNRQGISFNVVTTRNFSLNSNVIRNDG